MMFSEYLVIYSFDEYVFNYEKIKVFFTRPRSYYRTTCGFALIVRYGVGNEPGGGKYPLDDFTGGGANNDK